MKISLIAAVAKNGIIGANNDMPWHLPDDFAFFKRKTSHHPIIMGRKSLDALGKPLPNRTNIVITRNPDFQATGVTVTHTIDAAIEQARQINQEEIFVIGGAEIYAMALPIATTLYLTEIDKAYPGDTYFPAFDRSEWQEISRHAHPADERHETSFDFVEYQRKNDQ
ncbi:dihydrofolate reductase [Spirosoma sp. KUDC1026]|uniref:dihydrofolate reductase n=1 Tax=Spirosoma sp. KUDC1026 TaxID=2745947 RepID=UPI00159BC268|nr:dihydrofolate reductase [Spirosoma sp. KUDC1026]QKZ12377.1 dihydrofolate reductase [Spirosoma sp. KUDC1026]